MNTESALRTLARHRRRMAYDSMDSELDKLRRRLRRQRTVRLWLHQSLVAIGFTAMTGLTVFIMLSL